MHSPVDNILQSEDTWRVNHIGSDCTSGNHRAISIVIVAHQVCNEIAHVRFLAPDSAKPAVEWYSSIADYLLQFALQRREQLIEQLHSIWILVYGTGDVPTSNGEVLSAASCPCGFDMAELLVVATRAQDMGLAYFGVAVVMIMPR
jgi:hypothetical protein